jgi:hypothetical protein
MKLKVHKKNKKKNLYTAGIAAGSRTACVRIVWNWEFLLKNFDLQDCPVGIDMQSNGQLILIDSTMKNVPTGIAALDTASLLLDRVSTTNVNALAPGYNGGATAKLWYKGIMYDGGTRRSEAMASLTTLRADTDYMSKKRPTFDSADVGNALILGAKGDGITDDTAVLQAAINAHTVVFLPFGTYVISDTLELKPNTVLVGEGFTMLAAKAGAPAFADANNPKPMIQVPKNTAGTNVMADFMITTLGDNPGCSLLEWGSGPESGMFDVMYRVEYSVWGLLHWIGAGTIDGMWGWVADHDINTEGLITVKSPRGFLCEGEGPTMMFGTAFEHSSEYQYSLNACKNLIMILTQTETPYWQNPPTAWGISITNSRDITIYGTGLYNWFFGNQQSLLQVKNSLNVNMFAVNTYHSVNLLDGDIKIVAADAKHSFADNIMGFVNAWPAGSATGLPSPIPGANPDPAGNSSRPVTPTPVNDTDSNSGGSPSGALHSMSKTTAAIIGGVVGGLCILAIAAVVAAMVASRKRRAARNSQAQAVDWQKSPAAVLQRTQNPNSAATPRPSAPKSPSTSDAAQP